MTTRRQIENGVDDLKSDESGGRPLVVNHTGMWEKGKIPNNREASPHPELTTQRHPNSEQHNSLHLAIPNVWPSGFPSGIVFVYACNSHADKWPKSEDESNKIYACKLWDALDETQLKQEYELRKENGEPIPPLLEDYGDD